MKYRQKHCNVTCQYKNSAVLVWIAIFWGLSCTVLASPPLPQGLSPEKPKLPQGLQSPNLPSGLKTEKPKLPDGLSSNNTSLQNPRNIQDKLESLVSISGFWDVRGGLRTQDDPHQDQASLGETRLQIDLQADIGPVTAKLVNDFIYDALASNQQINLNSGQGWLDLREANLMFSPFSFVDFKIGRQILTWGTGDLIFVNDLFPKDWRAFFIGRDVAYLKAPSDAIKAAFFSKFANLDVVFTPWFDADRSISGERISYYNPVQGDLAGKNAVIQTQRPDSAEWSLRLYKNLGDNELAVYGYHGFWKSPAGQNPDSGKAIYPDLDVIGASIRRPLLAGIASFEMGYYHSPDAHAGNNPFVQNSEVRFLFAYEQEIVKNLTLGLQYYQEWMQDYANYLRNLPDGFAARDEIRHVVTQRLTWLTYNQNLALSLFSFFSPSDMDAYFRPKIHYKITDAWSAELGGNFFAGKNKHTFFGQFQKNNNVYMAFRFGF